MAESQVHFRYVAVDPAGRRVTGRLSASNDAGAFAALRREGLSPLELKISRAAARTAKARALTDRESADILGNLAELLRAGADMRTALDILGSRTARPAVTALCRALVADISGGEALETAFAKHLSRNQGFVGAMVAAGEAGGNLPNSLGRAADMIGARVKLRSKFTSIMAYPTFVLISTVAAVLALLLFVVPALEPLAADAGGKPPATLALLIAASQFLRADMNLLAAGLGGAVLAGFLAQRAGLLTPILDRLMLDGSARGVTRSLVFGGFAITLGGMLAAEAPMSDALRLSIRSVTSKLGRARLEPVLQGVRQGQSLSRALEEVSSFPKAIAQLAAVGEATGALGEMLARGGRLEEEAAISRIELIGQILGPAMIVALGGIVGLLMAGLLSGVSQLGQSALG
jgi:type II secretory pathway component PulF